MKRRKLPIGGRKIIKVGIVFSRELRNIVDWKTEE